MRKDSDLLADILKAIAFLEKYRRLGRRRFQKDELVRFSVIHQITILGEAARGVSEATRSKAPGVAWPAIVGMRNRLVHGYFEVDESEVWKTVVEDIPVLKRQIKKLV